MSVDLASVRRCSCGERLIDASRFCSACGRSLDSEYATAERSSTTVVDTARTTGLDRRWLVVAAPLLALVVAWSTWPRGSVDDRSSPTADAVSESAVAEVTEVDRIDDAVGADGSNPPPVVAERVQTRQIGTGAPLLGEVTGLRAIFVQSSSRVSVLDLDSGVLTSGATIYNWFEPLVVSGDWLVARIDVTLSAVPLGDLGARPVHLLGEDGLEPFALSIIFPEPRSDGTIEVVKYDDGGPSFVTVDVASGAAIDAFRPPYGVRPGTWIRSDVEDGERVFSTNDGGVYVSDDTLPLRTAEGRLVANDDERALVEQCDEALACRLGWLYRATWQPVDLAVPMVDIDGATFVGGTDWLLLTKSQTGFEQQWLFHVVSGDLRLLEAGEHLNFEQSAPPISPDGRWLALHESPNLVIVDLTTDRRHVIEGVEGLTGAMVLTTAEVGIGGTP
ncbi:MAG: hypothetical protein R2710_19645 [Acidimicrobiales bacterium]